MNDKIRIYLDTCVYCRPFDDQSQNRILRETDAFIRVLELAEAEKVVIVGSDVLTGEIDAVMDPPRSIEVRGLLNICKIYVEISEEIIKLAREIEEKCDLTGADALHITSSAAEARYFVTCDDFILSRGNCIARFMEEKGYKLKVISITEFIEEEEW